MLDSLLDSSDTELVANVLICHITEGIERLAPMTRIQPRANYTPYLSSHTKERMGQRDKLKWKALESRDPDDWKAFKREKNLTLKQQRKEKFEWANKLIGEDPQDGKKIWSAVDKICKSKRNNFVDKLVFDGVVTMDKKKMANGLNTFFVSKVANLVKEIPIPAAELLDELTSQSPVNVPQMELKELSSHGLDQLLKGVRRTPAAGIDHISGIILSDIYEVIKPSLLHLINLSMAKGVYPSILKLTKIIPVLKQGKDPAYPSSYRPVSNLSTIGKLIERATMDQVARHINLYNLSNKDQHGGRPQHSTTTCLGEVMEDVKLAQEKKMKVAIMAVDLSAAYDLCHHGILTQRCRLLNIGPDSGLWLSSFLGARSSLVEWEGTWSEPTPTGAQGVVQGGPSSGNLFNIYINQLPAQVNRGKLASTPVESTHKQYVDDGSTVARGATLDQLTHNLEDDFRCIQHFLHRHQMVINPGKTQVMQLRPTQKEPLTMMLDGARITSQPAIKILGLTIIHNLKFDEFLWKEPSSLSRRIQTKTSKVAALRTFLPPRTLHQVGNALINSSILYGSALWGATSKSNINKVQAAQVRAARIITRRWNRQGDNLHRQQLLESVEWPNVKQMIASSTLNLTKKAISGESSDGMNNLLKITKPPGGNRNQGLRVEHKGKADRPALTFAANSVVHFNNLPANLRDPKLTSKKFKVEVKSYIRNTIKIPQH